MNDVTTEPRGCNVQEEEPGDGAERARFGSGRERAAGADDTASRSLDGGRNRCRVAVVVGLVGR